MPRILDDLNEDPEFQALSPAAKTAVMQAAKRKPLVTMDAADQAPPKRTRSVVEREPAPDPLDAYLPKKPPVPKAVSARFKRAKEQDAVDQLAEDTRNRRIGMTAPALTAERLRENLAGAALQGAKDMGNPVQLGAEALGAALARPALDAIAEDDERKRPAIERAADRSPAARRIQPNYRPKDTIEYVAEFLQPIEDAGRQIAADPADALDPTRPGTAEGQAAFLGATGANLVDPIGDGAIGLAAKGAGKLAKAATNAIDPRARIASRIADAARAAERTGADLGDVGRVDPATQSGVLLDDGTPQKSWPERLDNLGQQTARRARGSVMKRGVTADNAESVMVERTRMMDDANRMQDTARSLLAGPERPAPATPLSPENYAPDGEMSPRTQRIAGDLRESIEQVEAAKRRPVPPAVTNMFVTGRPDPTPAQPGGGSALEPWQMRRDDFMRERVRPSRASEAPTLDRMIRNLRSPEGPPGISIENDYMPRFESEDPSIKMVVARGQDGQPIGVLRVFLDEGGQPDLISVAVDPAQRRQGVATSLYDAAKRAGYDVDRASGTEGLTDEGAAFNHARRVREAVAEGRPVPPEVLADYPGLATGQQAEGGGPFLRRLASEERGEFDINKLVPQPKKPAIPGAATAAEGGRTFETGAPVTFPFIRNTERAPRRVKARPDVYQQDVEPAGRYLLHNADGVKPQAGWEAGEVSFRNPLVLADNTGDGGLYDGNSWKARLSQQYGGLTGKKLSKAIAKDGHDGIVTVDKRGNTSEIVDLTGARGAEGVPQPKQAGTIAGMDDYNSLARAKIDLKAMLDASSGTQKLSPEQQARIYAAALERTGVNGLLSDVPTVRFADSLEQWTDGGGGFSMGGEYKRIFLKAIDADQLSAYQADGVLSTKRHGIREFIDADAATPEEAMERTLAHELGHQVKNEMRRLARSGDEAAAALIKQIEKAHESASVAMQRFYDSDDILDPHGPESTKLGLVSSYAGEDAEEFFAESWLSHHYEPEYLRKVNPAVADLIDEVKAHLAQARGGKQEGPSLTGRLLSEEDGAFRPGAIGDTLRRLFGRDKAPIPAPQAAVAAPNPAATPADAAALTIDRLPASRAGIPLEEINLDPKTYQFKESDAKTGRNARFKDSDEWDPDYLEQKQVIVHRRLDGRFYVADGHQRVNLARVRQQKGDNVPPLNAIVLDEAQGWTPDLVKIKASKINLGEATGSAVDVARLMRDSGVTAKALGLSEKSNLAIHGGHLSTLNDEALGFVANRGIDPAHASEAVKATNDPAMRLAILREIADDKPRDVTEAALIARDAVEAGIAAARPADQLSLVNLGDYSKSRRKTLYKVLSELEKQLRQQGTALKGAAANKEVLEGVEGSAINAAGTQAAATEAESLLQYLKSQAGLAGPFREAVKALAKEVEGGKPLSEAVAHARRQLSADLGLHAGGGAERPGAVPPAAGVAGLQDDAAGAPAGSLEGAPAAGVAPGPVAPAQVGPGLFGDQAQFEVPPAPEPEPAAPLVAEAPPTADPLPPEVAAQPAPLEPLPPEDYDPLVGYLPDTRTPPASTPEAGGPVVGRPRADLARPASPTDQKALDDAYRMRDRFVRSGNQRAVDEFQTRIDAIEAKYAAAPPPPPQSAKQLQGRLNMLKRHLREARAAGNSQRAGELSAQVDEIDGILNGSARWPDREPGVPLEDRSPRARANEREALQQQDLTKARRIDDGIHKRMHNLPGDPDNIAASIFENFRVNGGSPEESAILAEGVRRVMARADWNPHARVPFADVLQEAAETDPALVEELIRRGVPKDQMIPVQMQTALRQRQGQLQSFIADLRKEEERAILGQDIEGAQELGNAIQKAERDLDAILEITVPMGSKYARALRMEGLTAKREGFDTTFWMARVRRNATGDTMRPAPPKIERRVKEATSKGNEAKATKANALEQLRAMGIDTAALEAPATVESVMRESGLTRFMGKLKDWGMTARPGAIFPARMPGSATTPAVTKRQPPPMPDLSHLTPEQRATAEMLWREAADARIAEREAQVELTRTAADARMTTIPEAITNTRRAFLIAGVKTFERNILSNLSNIPLEGASKAIAAVPDRALSMLGLTKEPGARTIRLRQFQDVGSAMKTSVPQGFKEWGEILRHGQTAEDIARQEVVVEQNTGFPAWDGVVNIVFRNQAGADRPTYLYGYARSLQRQAWNLFPNDEAARRAFIANPPEAVANEALADAAFGVYQNDTTMNQALQGLGSTLRRGGTGGRGLAWVYDNLGALYKKTPSAVATRTTVDFTPIGAAARVLDALWENGLQKLNPEAQKAVTMAIGRGAVGTGVIATGWALAGQGAMTGYYRPDFKEEILTSGRTPGSIYFKGEWVPLQWLGPVGHLLAIGATLREAGAGTVLPFSDMGNWPTMAATGAGAAMQSVVDSPMAQSAKQMQEIMQPDERTAYQKGNKLAGSFVQGFIPSVINEFARARDTQADGYGRRRAVDDTSTTGAMVDSLKSRIPGLRETLPMAVDDLGREVREPGGAGAFMAWSGRPSEESQDRVVRAIIETGADLRGAQSSLRDAGGRGRADDVSIRLDPAQERDYRSTRGQAIYAEVAKALDSQAYQDAMRIGDPDRLRELVQDAIGRGSKSGTKAYRAREGSTIKDGRARALAEKDRRRDVRALPAAPWWDEPSATVPPALRGRTSTPASP